MTPPHAMWFLPFVVPICLYVAWTDLAAMKIRNHAVVALVAVFALIGPFVLPLSDWGWRWAHLGVVLALGFAMNLTGALGAGDAKFLAAASPFVATQDLGLVMWLLVAMSLMGLATHRAVRATPLRTLAPDWESWTHRGFPLGFVLGPALVAYLALSA